MCGVSDCIELDVNVIENLDVEVSISASKNPIESGETVVFTATSKNGGANAEYTFMVDGNIVQSGPENTYSSSSLADGQTITVEVTSSEQCVVNNTAQDALIIGVNFRPTLVAPTAFSPNGDNLNDEFRLYGPVDEIAEYSLKIYDRWGSQIFETKELSQGWDGQINGKPAPSGVYVWMADYTIRGSAVTPEGEVKQDKGTLMLIR